MARLGWFRLYTEARTDKKLETLTDSEHRVWFNLLCHSADQVERGLIIVEDMDLLALECANGEVERLDATLLKLQRLRIVRVIQGTDGGEPTLIHFIHFKDRQYDKPSDKPESVAERVERHREKLKRDETLCNAEKRDETPVTPRERDIEEILERETPRPPAGGRGVCSSDLTEADMNGTANVGEPSEFTKLYSIYPKRGPSLPALRAYKQLKPDLGMLCRMSRGLRWQMTSEGWHKDNGKYIPSLRKWIEEQRWEEAPIEVLDGLAVVKPPPSAEQDHAERVAIARKINAEIASRSAPRVTE
jgi:hypothetical protein